jgi:peptide/nickel transport system permease protein
VTEAVVARRSRPRWIRSVLGRPLVVVAIALLVTVVVVAITAPVLTPFRPDAINLRARLQPPSWTDGRHDNLFGTDALGRDVLTRIVYGARVSVTVGFSVVLVSGVLGTLIGLMAGYYRGWLDLVLSRIMDVQLAFPTIVLAIAIIAVLGPGLTNLIIVLSIANWVDYARVIRGETLSAREREYVEGARALGVPSPIVVFRHILPNVIAPTIVIATFSVASTIVAEASLSFLGLGVPPRIPSWGAMLAEGREHLGSAWWLGTIPGLAIALVVLAINIVGDWLRDFFDPRFAG